jgi:hypothetical protein
MVLRKNKYGHKPYGMRHKVSVLHVVPVQSVIPGLTRNPVFFWIPAFAGMTSSAVANNAVHIT